MNPETQIRLDKFKVRDYQRPLVEEFLRGQKKRYLAVWPRRCLSGNTHILMSNGSYKLLKDIEVGDEILSWDGNKFVPDIVKNKWSTGIKKTKIVKAGCGLLPVIASEDHKFAVTHSGQSTYCWRPVKEFPKFGLALNYAGLNGGSIHNPELAEFLGYMLSDGYCSAYQQPKFTNNNMDILKRFEYLASKLFDVQVVWRPKGNGFDLGISNGTKGGGAFKNELKELFRADGQHVSHKERRLLKLIWDFDEASILRFFAGFISGDGSLYVQKHGFTAADTGHNVPAACEITLHCGNSYLMGWDIYWLLRKIGIVPQTPTNERGSNWKIKVSKNSALKKILSCGPIVGKTEKQNQILATLPDNMKETQVNDGCFRNKIRISDGVDEELFDIETTTHHNFIANGYVVHNSGKDIVGFNLILRAAIKKVGTYFYIFPTFSSGRRILWDAINNDGFRILNYIPDELIDSKNEQQMRIRLINGSVIQVLGSDSYDNTLVGTNARGMIFSEYALQDERAYQFARPILTAIDGWAMFLSTPRGKNHLYTMYQIAQESPDWFVSKLTVHDTQHIPLHEIEKERATGEMSDDLIQQEYFTSFDMGVEGAYYSKYIDRMRVKGQIGIVPWESAFPVHTAWDLGMRDSTCIIFFQIIGQTVRIIDCYEKNKEGLEHYVNIINEKEYSYGKHFAPHDIKVRELGSGLTRLEKARQLGIKFTVADNIPVTDGIECVRSSLSKIWIDDRNCASLIKALENYRQEYDVKRKIYKSHPLHDVFSHFADCMRYLCISLPKTRDGATPESIERNYREAVYGTDLPDVFNFPTDSYRY